jgi:hypothetical protein
MPPVEQRLRPAGNVILESPGEFRVTAAQWCYGMAQEVAQGGAPADVASAQLADFSEHWPGDAAGIFPDEEEACVDSVRVRGLGDFKRWVRFQAVGESGHCATEPPMKGKL